MQQYRSLLTAVYRAEQRLAIVTAACGRDEDTTLADIERVRGLGPARPEASPHFSAVN